MREVFFGSIFLQFATSEEQMSACRIGCCEDVDRAAVFQMKPFAQFLNGEGEVAHRHVGAVNALE